MRTALLVTATLLGMSSVAIAQKKQKFSTTPENLQYSFVTGKERTKKNPALKGDFLSIKYKLAVNDSILVPAPAADAAPTKLNLPEYLPETRFFSGLPIEGIYKMNEGDSTIFRTSAKEYFSSTGLPQPEWIKDTDTFQWNVKVVKFESLVDFKDKNAKLRKKNPEFLKTEGGLEYKFFDLGKGGRAAGPMDIANFHVVYAIGDSVIFNSVKFNENKPVPQQLQIPQTKGDLMEGLLLMQAGDSAVFKINLKEAFANLKMDLQPWMKETDDMRWEVRMVDLKSQDELKAEEEALAKSQIKNDDATILQYFKDNNITNFKKTESGLYYVIHSNGNGKKPTKGQKIAVNYTGKNLNGESFDSSVDPKFNHVEPLEFNVGAGSVIKGWDEGLMLLDEGAKATLYIPSPLGYGSRGAGKDIAPNAILIFDVELVQLK